MYDPIVPKSNKQGPIKLVQNESQMKAVDLTQSTRQGQIDPLRQCQGTAPPTHEFGDAPETPPTIKNIGWTLGNYCPYHCTHCYSLSTRQRGRDMNRPIIDRIIAQLKINRVKTTNLGGNEPLFTNGTNPQDTLLPYIIEELVEAGIEVGLTTSGITLLWLYHNHRGTFDLLNDVDISLDSPFEEEHNKNRGAKLYRQALESAEICGRHDKSHSIIMCAMNWNFSSAHIRKLVTITKRSGANLRINPLKPIESHHLKNALTSGQYYAGFAELMQLCVPIDLGEPPLAAVTEYSGAKRCPCGRTSFRIHSITPEGKIYVSPCVYLHDYKSSLDLLENDLAVILSTQQFRVFRQRHRNPELIHGCKECSLLASCGGGCVARAYLDHLHHQAEKSMLARDPYCPKEVRSPKIFPRNPRIHSDQLLVHMDYLCTWIGSPL